MKGSGQWLVGTYFSKLLVVPQERVEACRKQLQILIDVVSDGTWEELLSRYTIDDIEGATSSVLDAAWWQSDPEPEDDRQSGQLPPLGVVRSDVTWEARAFAADCLDDADQLVRFLPQEVMALAQFPATSPMTEYEPCHWKDADLPEIERIAQEHGIIVIPDQGAFGGIETLFASR